MMFDVATVAQLDDHALMTSTLGLVKRSNALTADLLIHLGEIDARKLYAARAFSSMFAFCQKDLGFSEDVAYARIAAARLARRLPAVLDAVRAGLHLAGLRVLEPHLTETNHRELLDEATGKSKRDIEEIVARIAPKSPVPATIRKLPERTDANAQPMADPLSIATPPVHEPPTAPNPIARPEPVRPAVKPLAPDIYKVQFTASRALRDKLTTAQDLLRHQNPGGDLAKIVEMAMDLLIEHVKRKRFGLGKKPRAPKAKTGKGAPSRAVPAEIKRAVYERDGGQCTFADEAGRRCQEKAFLEYDHVDGFALQPEHSADRIRILCRTHNQYTADRLYGRAMMDERRNLGCKPRSLDTELTRPHERVNAPRPGAGGQPRLL